MSIIVRAYDLSGNWVYPGYRLDLDSKIGQTTIEDIPVDVTKDLLDKLSSRDLRIAALACKQFYFLANEILPFRPYGIDSLSMH